MVEQKENMNPPVLDPADLPSIGHVSNFYKLLLAIDEAMPKHATLYIEGRPIVGEIREFVASRQVALATIRQIKGGTLYPTPIRLHLSLKADNLLQLREIASRYAEPEIADHLGVYQDDEILLWAPDAGFGDVYANSALGETVLTKLRETLGDSLE